jgi:hAT family C-terminal dimerisation region
MAITIFTIPPMSAGPEQVFSGGKDTIAPERIRLRATMVEMAECLKSWIDITPGRQQAGVIQLRLRIVDLWEEANDLLQEIPDCD